MHLFTSDRHPRDVSSHGDAFYTTDLSFLKSNLSGTAIVHLLGIFLPP